MGRHKNVSLARIPGLDTKEDVQEIHSTWSLCPSWWQVQITHEICIGHGSKLCHCKDLLVQRSFKMWFIFRTWYVASVLGFSDKDGSMLKWNKTSCVFGIIEIFPYTKLVLFHINIDSTLIIKIFISFADLYTKCGMIHQMLYSVYGS